MKIFNVYDSKTEAWDIPFIRDHTENALRDWRENAADVDNKQNKIARFPGDFSLFEIGEYDRTKNFFNIYAAPFNHGTALQHQIVVEK